VILAEFGNERHPQYPDQDTNPNIPGPARFDGPQHDQIPAPDRSKDNSTVWQPDYEPAHYRQLYFGTGDGVESVKTYYERQSSGRYSVDGQVTDWVRVPFNEARYGRSDGFPCASNVCSNTWFLIRDAINTWVEQQHAAGRTDAQIKADLASYDEWDRNDFDHDGNFNEPDGYIDHFQIVHSGGDQADGDPNQGEDAIWSHRWKAFQNTGQGPANHPDGGTQIGTTGLWVADYTIQPENGGVSVFAHEYGHDLGLPDLYDTSGGGENGVNWWSIMAQSRVSAPQDEGIGTRGADLGAWEKLQLGWLDYEIVGPGRTRTLDLGPHEYNSAKAQGVVTVLPQKEVVTQLGAPAAGSKQWWSGQGDDLNSSMTRDVTLPAGGPASLTFQARWNIEDCGPDACDYAYVEVDDGSGFKAIPGSIAKAAEGNGIDGKSNGYQPATFDLSAFAGKAIKLRFRYQTDGAVQGTDPQTIAGFFADEIKITANGTDVFTDGAETSPNGWTLDGFTSVGATKSQLFDNYYVASNREYVSYDRYLQSGPYNFGFPDRPDWVEHFPYQNGLLVSYWDTSFSDNNTSEHPGHGEILAIDSHPEAIFRLDGKPWRSRIQGYDAPFSLERADSFTLHAQETGRASLIRGQNAVPLFDDRREFWDPATPNAGVKVPHAGVQIRVLSQNGTSMRIRVQPAPAAAAARR
jgi:immune inhibitor A